VTTPGRRVFGRLGAVWHGGRPVHPDCQRYLAAAWAGGETRIHRARRQYLRRMSAMHSAYHSKTKGRR
jgi:hypothetical protein